MKRATEEMGELIEQMILTGGEPVQSFTGSKPFHKTRAVCFVCGAINKSVDKQTRKLLGPYVCGSHPIQDLDFEWQSENTPLAGGEPSPAARACLSCGCNLSRYNPDMVCAPCINSAPLEDLGRLIGLAHESPDKALLANLKLVHEIDEAFRLGFGTHEVALLFDLTPAQVREKAKLSHEGPLSSRPYYVGKRKGEYTSSAEFRNQD
jgi:hypothetical protein